MAQANIQQLLDAIGQLVTAQQQQQINQPNPNNNVPVPVLPDISVFEPTDEKGRITEWIERSPKDATLRQRILSKLGADGDNVKYDEIVQDCINFMTTISEAKLIENSAANRSINAVKPKWHKTEKGGRPNSKQYQSSSAPAQQCWRCGWTNHSHWECKHKSAKCQKCSQNGHLEGQCDKVQEWRRRNKLPIPKRKIGNLRIGTAMKVNSASLFKTNVAVDGKNIKFVLDSGAEIIVIDELSHEVIGSPRLRKCTESGCMFDGTQVKFIGKGVANFKFRDICIKSEYYVAKRGSLNLLSVQMMDAFGLLNELKAKINAPVNLCRVGDETRGFTKASKSSQNSTVKAQIDHLKASFPDIFKNELGRCLKFKAHLTLKADAAPVYRKARPVPYNAQEAIDGELEPMEKNGIEYISTNDFGQADVLSRLIAKELFDEWFLAKERRRRKCRNKCAFSSVKDQALHHENCLDVRADRSSSYRKNLRQKFFIHSTRDTAGIKKNEAIGETNYCLFMAKYWTADIPQTGRKTAKPCQMEVKAPVNKQSPTIGQNLITIHGKESMSELRWTICFGKEYLIIVRCFFEIPGGIRNGQPTIDSGNTRKTSVICSGRHGIPEILVSDNGTQFTSNEFAKFTRPVNGVNHLFFQRPALSRRISFVPVVTRPTPMISSRVMLDAFDNPNPDCCRGSEGNPSGNAIEDPQGSANRKIWEIKLTMGDSSDVTLSEIAVPPQRFSP
ncbi:hypothetical protein niasHT_039632 [Heterodera trifolii]|uniref:Endonuclease n=1 Tax=Heterodera trifolii TaxID=157864 RepID=A0ABD2IYB0_9BILA